MIKGIIFDIDGVLIDSEEFYMNRRMKFFEENNIEPGSRDINDFIGSNIDRNWEMLVPDDEKLRKELRDRYLNIYEPNNLIDFKRYCKNNVCSIMNNLKDIGFKIALASAGSEKNIRKLIVELSLGDYIDFYISGEKCKYNKPNPEIYIKSIKEMNLDAKEIIVVEDSEHGIEAAKKAGLKVIAIRPVNYKIDQKKADFIIDDLREIMELINNDN